jgi:hypothetical protein
MQFCHIAPIAALDMVAHLRDSGSHLTLAHLVETSPEYVEAYQQVSTKSTSNNLIMDNSGYERYTEGLPMFEPSKLIELAEKIHARYIVLPDEPGKSSTININLALDWMSSVHQAGFKTFFVPQSEIGEFEDYVAGFAWAASCPGIDYIGMSILGVPNAFGVYKDRMQRYVSRFQMFTELERRGLLQLAKINGKKIHCLGMLDGPREIHLLSKWIIDGTIDTWDSSSAVWHGYKGFVFDNTPTGLLEGKTNIPVDFNIKAPTPHQRTLIQHNLDYINNIVKELNSTHEPSI